MIRYSVDQASLKKLTRDLRKLGHIIADPNMQLYRAKKFRDFTIDQLMIGSLGLKPLSPLTKIISGDHTPEYKTGELAKRMRVRPGPNKSAEAGYFNTDKEKPQGKKITYTKIAVLQHTGFRIPLFGKKGERVKKWLAVQLSKNKGAVPPGLNDMSTLSSVMSFMKAKSSSKWLYVPPRPFVFRSINLFEEKGEDIKAVDEFLNKIVNSPVVEKS